MPYYRCAACALTTYSAAGRSSPLVCPECEAALTEDAKLYVTPGANHNVSRVLLARPEAPAEARRALVGLPFDEATREELALLVTELVTNSLRHAGLSSDDRIGISLVNGAGRVRLAVHDGGPGFTPRPFNGNGNGNGNGGATAGGRGLELVESLSNAWGVRSAPDGCTVWCEVLLDPEPATS
jgi:anti-sigma regulatory factor (Ser/Thr protein kinase)